MKFVDQHADFARWLLLQTPADRRVLARGWQIEDELAPAELAERVLEPQRVAAQWERLGADERRALSELLAAGGSLPVAIVQRSAGGIREPANFPNPRSYLQALHGPSSPAERLYLLGLIVRHHDERGQIFRIPREFIALLPHIPPAPRCLEPPIQPTPHEIEQGTPAEVESVVLAFLIAAYHDSLQTLDDGGLNKASLVKVAAWIEPKPDLRGLRRESDWPWISLVRAITVAAGLLRRTPDGLLLVTPAALNWLAATPVERMQTLLEGWINCPLNELIVLGGLRWRSTPYNLKLPLARTALRELLATLPPQTWFRLTDLVAAVKAVDPYFLRRDGRFDTWLIYDERDHLIAGEQHWPKIEGELIMQAVGQILFWFGLVDCADHDESETTQIAINALGAAVLGSSAVIPPVPAPEPLVVQSTFEVICPPGASMFVRFQLLRVAELVRANEVLICKLTRKALLRAAERGITGDEVIAFLEQASATPVPPAVEYSLRQWQSQVGQVVVESTALLRADPVLLAEIKRNKSVQLPPVEELRPEVWAIPAGDASELINRLKQAGFGINDQVVATQTPLNEHDLKALVTAAYAYAQLCTALDLPCEISASLLTRLRKLVPARHTAAAQQAAETLRQRISQPE